MRGDIEDCTAVLKAWLTSSRFTTTLAAVNAEKADGYTTPDPQQVYPHPRAVLEAYPAAQLIGTRTTYDADAIEKAATHRIGILWTVVGDREDHLTSDVERLMRATRDLFWRQTLDGGVNAGPIHIESEDYSELLPGPEGSGNPFAKAGLTTLVFETYVA